MTYNQIISNLKGLKDETRRRYKAELKGFFGSYARGEATADSDIDILVEFLAGATLLDLTGLGNYLEDKLQCKVDIVSQRALRKELEPYIYKDIVYL